MANKIAGALEVGTNGRGEVIINGDLAAVDAEGRWHIVFSPDQARGLGYTLLVKADTAEGEKSQSGC